MCVSVGRTQAVYHNQPYPYIYSGQAFSACFATRFARSASAAANTSSTASERTQGCAANSADDQSSRPQGMVEHPAQGCFACTILCSLASPQGPKTRVSVGP